MDLYNKKIIFIGGKGGVGKTTSSAALALQAAELGKKTLLVSTDPAHNIGHIFNKQVGGKATKIIDNLHALEIDPEKETQDYINEVKQNIKGIVQPTMIEEVNRQLDTARASPGADEAALFDKLISIILEESTEFDQLIFDTAPTGHTIRLLTLPELMGVWIQGLLEKRHKTQETYTQLLHDGEPIEDPIFDVLKGRQTRFTRAREVMLDEKRTGFVFVLNPERLPIIETKQAIDMLEKYELYVETLIVNRILPEKSEGQFLQQRKQLEAQYVEEIKQTFADRQLFFIPLFAHDITSLSELREFAGFFKG